MQKNLKNALLVLLAASIAFGCAKKGDEDEEDSGDEITAVKVEKIAKTSLHDYFTTNGNIKVRNSLEIYSAVNGLLTGVFVRLGQKVSKGEEIALVDPSVNGGNYALYRLTAPVSGTILSTPPAVGSMVTSERKIVLMGNLSDLQIVSYVPERYYARLKTGLKATIKVEAYGDREFDAEIKEISPVIDEESRTCEVTLSLAKKNSEIVAGMFAEVAIILESFDNVYSVPEDCVLSKDGEDFVYKVTENTAELCKVEIGNVYDHRRIITQGLCEGDFVITEGYETVADGGIVNVVFGSVYESH
ncbi:MAG: efflux RND transporter periplasmic adaptor subunit [Treponemataceae bacterium]|nr:efflux RND transporter periplasmic adaptor subunit [Treponemataceae bacterium]